MPALGTLRLDGYSGRTYSFDIYAYDTSITWNPVAGIYIITHYGYHSHGYGHNIIYIGQTNNLSERLTNHHKKNCFTANNANRLCFLSESRQNQREYIESDLINNYSTPCNY